MMKCNAYVPGPSGQEDFFKLKVKNCPDILVDKSLPWPVIAVLWNSHSSKHNDE